MQENSISNYKERKEGIKNLCLAITFPSLVITGLFIDYFYGICSEYILCGTGVLSCTLIGLLLLSMEVIVWYNHPTVLNRSVPQHKNIRLIESIEDRSRIHQSASHEVA